MRNQEVLTKERFYHFRAVDENNNFLPRGGVTVCLLPSDNGRTINVGVSVCTLEEQNPTSGRKNPNFDKRFGVNRSRGFALKQRANNEFSDLPNVTGRDARAIATEYALSSWRRVSERRGWDQTALGFVSRTEDGNKVTRLF